MKKRTKANYEAQKRSALVFGQSTELKKVLFGTCDTCDYFFAENIVQQIDSEESYLCDLNGCKGAITQVFLNVPTRSHDWGEIPGRD